jgi:para-nitrobenzyl esterase
MKKNDFSPSRRALLLQSVGVGVCAALSRRSWAESDSVDASQASREFAQVDTVEGRLRGLRENGVYQFRGVRYAGAPVGRARFKAPPPLEKWRGVRDALVWGNPALQARGQTFGINEPLPDEDCLLLNIWTPAVNDCRKRPVMFYCHGGGFWIGSGASILQDGSNLARDNDVVVVQSNHRLGIMGYLFLADVLGEPYAQSANAGLLDIVAALQWTQRNIEAFGGDPSNVMVWGESGGGAKTSCIYAMPSADRYFHKASIESGPGVRMTEREQANRTTHWVLNQLGLTTRQAHKLLDVPAEKLLQVQLNPPPNGSLGLYGGRRGIGASGVGGFSPVVDGLVLPAHPFDPSAPAVSADKPLIVGSNRDEIVFFHMTSPDKSPLILDEAALNARIAKLFGANAQKLLTTYRRTRPDASPTDIAVAIESAAFAGAGSIAIAERKAAQRRAPVFMYTMTDHINATVPGTNYQVGAAHAMDIRLKFDNLAPAESRMRSLTQEEHADHVLAAKNMSRMWASFARTSQPAAPGQPFWLAYDLDTRATMMIAARCHVANDPYPAEREVWAEIGSISTQQNVSSS